MSESRTKLPQLLKQVKQLTGGSWKLEDVAEMLVALNWDRDNDILPIASVDSETCARLLEKLGAKSEPEKKVKPEAVEKKKVEPKSEVQSSTASRTRLRGASGAADLAVASPTTTLKKKREGVKTFFDAADLAGKIAKVSEEKVEEETIETVTKTDKTAPVASDRVIDEKTIESKKETEATHPVKPSVKQDTRPKDQQRDFQKKKPQQVQKEPALKVLPEKGEEITDDKRDKKKKPEVAKKEPEKRQPIKKKIKEIVKLPDEVDHVRSVKRVFKSKGQRGEVAVKDKAPKILRITGDMAVRELSVKSGVKVGDIIGFLLKELDVFANINHVVSVEEVELISSHFGIQTEVKLNELPEDILEEYDKVLSENLRHRSPVVTVMGHVDHGKTKLLDRIRNTNVVAGEAGGITQHIGAYQVIHNGKAITFIDTPGHAAFTQMRARGSQVTDIVILVVATDDGVKPQTKEAIEHARAAKVPIIVALNKCDLPSSNPERTMTQVSELGLVPEEWGGDTVYVKVSALKGDNINELLEMILLQAELLELKADPKAPAYGVVIESEITKGQGVIVTTLVVQGTLRAGQFVVCGSSGGRIKRMEDEWSKEMLEALPSRPVRIIGLDYLPQNGDKIFTFEDKRKATEIIAVRKEREKLELQKSAPPKTSLEDFFSRFERGEVKDLNLIVKTDVGGSDEAIQGELKRVNVEGVQIKVLSHGVGQITENDVMLASASDAIIIGFSTSLTSGAKKLVDRERVDVRTYDIIYQMTEEIEKAMKGMLEPVFEEIALGRIEIREIFRTDKSSVICGGIVLDGKVERNKKYRLLRRGDVIHQSTLRSLRRFKEDVKDVASGYECGFVVEGTSDVQTGDILSVYDMKEVSRF
jgi:translation initiation factor IF-2